MKSCYAAIIGRDIMCQLGLMLDFKNQQLHWDEVTIPMRSLLEKNKKKMICGDKGEDEDDKSG